MRLQRLFQPIDIAPLVFFRIVGMGLITAEILGEWASAYRDPYLQPDFHFTYVLTPWLEPWPAPGVHVHFALNALFGAAVTLGLFYRVSTIGLFIGTGLLFLMEKSVYINHTYLYILVAFLMIFVPSHRGVSLDAKRDPRLRSAVAPAWCLWVLRFQISVVYVFAGLAKLNADWLRGAPMDLAMANRRGNPIVGPLLALEELPVVMSVGGAVLDLLVVPALLWRRSRLPAFLLATLFHLANVLVFGLGTFPWLSIVMTALFFPPETFRRLPVLRSALPAEPGPGEALAVGEFRRRTIALGLGLYVLFQVLVPLRQWLYPGNPSWTEYGHRFSWRMMLRAKTGSVRYHVLDRRTGERWIVDPAKYLDDWQHRDMFGKPDMILEFAHDLSEWYELQGREELEIRAEAKVGLNGRPEAHLVDPTVDLLRQERGLAPYTWVLDLPPDP